MTAEQGITNVCRISFWVGNTLDAPTCHTKEYTGRRRTMRFKGRIISETIVYNARSWCLWRGKKRNRHEAQNILRPFIYVWASAGFLATSPWRRMQWAEDLMNSYTYLHVISHPIPGQDVKHCFTYKRTKNIVPFWYSIPKSQSLKRGAAVNQTADVELPNRAVYISIVTEP